MKPKILSFPAQKRVIIIVFFYLFIFIYLFLFLFLFIYFFFFAERTVGHFTACNRETQSFIQSEIMILMSW